MVYRKILTFLFKFLLLFLLCRVILNSTNFEQAARLEQGEITKEEYEQWRYKYPELNTSKQWKKVVPSQGLSDMLIEN